MKILIDARFYGLENSGLGRYTMNLVEELHQIDSKNEYYILLNKKYFNQLKFETNWHKIEANYKHYSFSEQLYIPKLLKKINPDVTHFLHFNAPITFNGVFIVTIHDLIMHKSQGKRATTLPLPLYHLKRLAYSQVFKNSVLKAHKIIVPSQVVAEDLIRQYSIEAKKIEVIYEGVDQKAPVESGRLSIIRKYNLGENYFIYTGNAYPHKNLTRVIEAVVEINKTSPKRIMFAIVSSRNVFTNRLQKLIKELGAEEFVKLLGFVPDSEITFLYKNSLGFVYPSLMEGFGLPGLEAMAAGTVVLVSDIPVFHEIYKKNVAYFNPYDYTSIKKALESAVELDAKTRSAVVEHGRKFVKRYSWRTMAEETLKVYESSAGIR